MKVIYLSLFFFSSVAFSGLSSTPVQPTNLQYSPYVWITYFASQFFAPVPKKDLAEKTQTQILNMLYPGNEENAKKLFNQKLEFKTVDYGYSNETNYGIFAKETIDEGEVVGIYSGATFLIKHPVVDVLLKKTPEELSEIPPNAIRGILAAEDYFAYCTYLLNQYEKLDGSTHRSPMKYTYQLHGYDDAILRVIPCGGIHTPMHFVNSCNDDGQENVKIKSFDLGEDKKADMRRFISCYVSKKVINPGEEILDDYMTRTEYRDSFFETIEDEKKTIETNLKYSQGVVANFNLKLPKKKQVDVEYAAHLFYIEKMKPENKTLKQSEKKSKKKSTKK